MDNNQMPPQGPYNPQTGQWQPPQPPPEYPAGAAPGQQGAYQQGGYPPPPGYPPQGQPYYQQGQPGYPPPEQQPYYPQGQAYYPPGQGYQPVSSKASTKATASLILGVAALVCVWFGYFAFLAFVAAIVGLILAVQARKELPAGSRGVATGGLVLCISTLVLSILMILCVVIIGAAVCDALGEARDLANGFGNFDFGDFF